MSNLKVLKTQSTKMFLNSSQFIKRNSPLCTSGKSHLTSVALVPVVILWWVVLLQTFAHALVVPSVAVLWSSVVIAQKLETFDVFSVACATAVKQVQTEELAAVSRGFLEHHCGGQDAIDRPVFKQVETGVVLLRKERKIQDVRWRLLNNSILGKAWFCEIVQFENEKVIKSSTKSKELRLEMKIYISKYQYLLLGSTAGRVCRTIETY